MDAESGFESVRRLVVIGRIAGAAFILAGLLPVPLLFLLQLGFGTGGFAPNAFMLTMFGLMSAAEILASAIAYPLARRLSRKAATYLAVSLVGYFLASGALLISFVASIVAQSALPYAAFLVPACLLWLLHWPRASAWARWASRPSGVGAAPA
jgi:hypothetical protein